MSLEIEHKYLVISSEYEKLTIKKYKIAQGYLSRDPERTVRVRIRDHSAFLTVKGKTYGDTRLEFEYEIPYADGQKMLNLCQGRVVEKTRHIVPYEGHTWEVDVFGGDLSPLRVAEIELPASDTHYALPSFVGREVTDDPAYFNSNL